MGNNKGKGIFALIFGAIIGAITALFMGTDKKGNTKKSVKDSVRKTKKKAKEIDKNKVLEKAGIVLDKASKEFKDAKKALDKKLVLAKKKLDTIDKTKYQKIVKEVVTELKKSGKATGAQLKDISTLLAADYKKVAPKKSASAKKSKKK